MDEMLSVELGERVLTVHSDGITRLYGRWDCLFGCWEREGEVGPWREIIPYEPFLKYNGLWREDALLSSPLEESYLSPDLTCYFSLVPAHYCRLVAPLGQYQWFALDLIWMVPELANFIDEEAGMDTHQTLMQNLVTLGISHSSRELRCQVAERALAVAKRAATKGFSRI